MSTTQCLPAYDVQFVAPASGDFVDGGGGPVMVQVTVAADSGFDAPASVVLSQGLTTCDTDGGGLTSDGGTTYVGQWVPVQKADGPELLCVTAYWPDGGVVASSPERTVRVDVTPPMLALSLNRDPANNTDPSGSYQPAFARDEDPVVIDAGVVETGSGLRTLSYVLAGEDGGVVAGVDQGGGINLQAPAIGEHGTFIATVVAVDDVGNVSATETIRVLITRWKWVATLPVSQSSLGTPAVGPGGGIIYDDVILQNGSILGNVFALSGDGAMVADGGTLWSSFVASNPIAGPALAPTDSSKLFVLDGVELSILNADGGGVDSSYQSDGGEFTQLAAQFAVGRASASSSSADTAFVAGVSAAASGAALYAIPTSGTPFLTVDSTVAYPVGAMVDGNVAWWAGNGASGIIDIDPANTIAFGTAKSLNGLAESVNSGPYGTPNEAFFAGGGGGVALVHAIFDGGSIVETPAALSFSNNLLGEVLVPNAGQALVQVNGTDLELASVVGSTWVVDAGPSGVHGDVGMVLAGRGLYAASSTAISAVDMTQGTSTRFGSLMWQVNLTSLGANGRATAAPSLTCSGNGESVLLVPAKGKLIGLVIDEGGLNSAAPWPKARRDFGNTANVALPLSGCP